MSEPCSRPEMALLSWNIERGVHYREILDALRRSLPADLYLRQEMDLFTQRSSYRDMTEELAQSSPGATFLELNSKR